MSKPELAPAIDTLKRLHEEAERKANGLLDALNVLLAEAGLPPHKPGGGSGGGGGSPGPTVTQIRSDTFFGQKQQTAIRSYLDMRRAQGLGPAKPREIYEALSLGGYQYEAKDAETALVGLRALLRKRTNIFMKLPNGTYGLAAWYPDARRPKPDAADDGDDADDDEQEPKGKAAPNKKSDAA